MAQQVGSVYAVIGADISAFSAAMKTVKQNLEDTGSGFRTLAQTGSILGQALLPIGAALTAVGVKSMFTAGRTEELGVILEVVRRNALAAAEAQGDYARASLLSANSVKGLVAAVKERGITTQVATKLVAQMIRHELDLAKATELARLAQRVATFAAQDSSEALEGLLHGILTYNPRVLRTYNITVLAEDAFKKYAAALGKTATELTNTERTQAMLNEVLAQGKNIQGAYEAAMTTASKQWRTLARYVEEAQNALGKGLQPTFLRFVQTLTAALKWFLALDERTQSLIGHLTLFGGVITTVVGTTLLLLLRIMDTLAALKIVLAAVQIQSVATWAAMLGPFALVAAGIAGITYALYRMDQAYKQVEHTAAEAHENIYRAKTYEQYVAAYKEQEEITRRLALAQNDYMQAAYGANAATEASTLGVMKSREEWERWGKSAFLVYNNLDLLDKKLTQVEEQTASFGQVTQQVFSPMSASIEGLADAWADAMENLAQSRKRTTENIADLERQSRFDALQGWSDYLVARQAAIQDAEAKIAAFQAAGRTEEAEEEKEALAKRLLEIDQNYQYEKDLGEWRLKVKKLQLQIEAAEERKALLWSMLAYQQMQEWKISLDEAEHQKNFQLINQWKEHITASYQRVTEEIAGYWQQLQDLMSQQPLPPVKPFELPPLPGIGAPEVGISPTENVVEYISRTMETLASGISAAIEAFTNLVGYRLPAFENGLNQLLEGIKMAVRKFEEVRVELEGKAGGAARFAQHAETIASAIRAWVEMAAEMAEYVSPSKVLLERIVSDIKFALDTFIERMQDISNEMIFKLAGVEAAFQAVKGILEGIGVLLTITGETVVGPTFANDLIRVVGYIDFAIKTFVARLSDVAKQNAERLAQARDTFGAVTEMLEGIGVLLTITGETVVSPAFGNDLIRVAGYVDFAIKTFAERLHDIAQENVDRIKRVEEAFKPITDILEGIGVLLTITPETVVGATWANDLIRVVDYVDMAVQAFIAGLGEVAEENAQRLEVAGNAFRAVAGIIRDIVSFRELEGYESPLPELIDAIIADVNMALDKFIAAFGTYEIAEEVKTALANVADVFSDIASVLRNADVLQEVQNWTTPNLEKLPQIAANIKEAIDLWTSPEAFGGYHPDVSALKDVRDAIAYLREIYLQGSELLNWVSGYRGWPHQAVAEWVRSFVMALGALFLNFNTEFLAPAGTEAANTYIDAMLEVLRNRAGEVQNALQDLIPAPQTYVPATAGGYQPIAQGGAVTYQMNIYPQRLDAMEEAALFARFKAWLGAEANKSYNAGVRQTAVVRRL